MKLDIKARYGVETAKEVYEQYGNMLPDDVLLCVAEECKRYRAQACAELCRRSVEGKKRKPKFMTPQATVDYLMPLLCALEQENFVVLTLTVKNSLIKMNTISVGSLTASVVHPREVFKAAILDNAGAIIVAHNHPSGNSYPSVDDNNITTKLVEAGKIMGIPVLDHVIIGANEYYSYKEEGKI